MPNFQWIADDAYRYTFNDGATVQLVTETVSEVEVHEIEGLAPILEPGPPIRSLDGGVLIEPGAPGIVLIGPDDAGIQHTLDLRDRSIMSVEIDVPEGYKHFACLNGGVANPYIQARGIVLDEVGALVMPVRDEQSARVLRKGTSGTGRRIT